MQLSNSDLSTIKKLLDTCRIAGIDNVLVSTELISGLADSGKTAIIAKNQIDSEFAIGISDCDALLKRFGIFGDAPITASLEGRNNQFSQVILKSGRSKVDFRCRDPQSIRAPKENPDEVFCQLSITGDEVKQINSAINALGATILSINITRAKTVTIEVQTAGHETFTVDLGIEPEFEGAVSTFNQSYDAKILAKILTSVKQTQDSGAALVVGANGSITVDINGFDVIVLSNIDTDEDE